MLFFLFVFGVSVFWGQQKTIDSLFLAFNTIQTVEERVDIWNELAWEFRTLNAAEGLLYAYNARALSTTVTYTEGYHTSLNRIGVLLIHQGKYEEAIAIYHDLLKREEAHKNSYGIARAEHQLGLIYKKTGNLKEAIYYTTQSLSKFESLGRQKQVAITSNNIGALCKEMGAYEEAMEYYLKSLSIREQLNDRRGIAYSYLNLGAFHNFLEHYDVALKELTKSENILTLLDDQLGLSKVYTNMGNAYFNKQNLEQALHYYTKSLALKEQFGVVANRNVLFTNIGLIHEKKGALDTALEFYQKNIQNDSTDHFGGYNNMANVFRKQKQFHKALAYYQKSLTQAKKNHQVLRQLEVLKNIADTYAEIRKFDEAVTYNTQFNTLRDSMELRYKKAMELKVNYDEVKKKSELLQKEQEIKQANLETYISENKRKNILLYALLSVFILMSILFFSIWRTTKQRQQLVLAEKNKKIQQQRIQELLKNQELRSIHTMINAQEKERKRIAQDLHDRLGSMLSMVKIHFKSVSGNPEKTSDQYHIANTLLDDACEEIRKIAHNMSSGVLSKFGLIPALHELTSTIKKSNQIEIDCIDHGIDDRLEGDVEINVYRIIQEVLSNVLRHAQATEVTIQVLKHGTTLGVMVEDNGIGFREEDREYKEGMGLLNIRSRVDQLHGEMIIDSGKGSGTTININIPIA